MATQDKINYKRIVEKKLKPHPIARTTEELENALPPTADPTELRDTLDTLERQGRIKQIGDAWRWMDL